MFFNISQKLTNEFKNYKIQKIESGASNKIFYRLNDDYKSFILIDFILDKKEFNDFLKIYNILKNIDISIPALIEVNDQELTLLVEDFGNLRFDKILKKTNIKNLLNYALDTLIILNNSVKFDKRLLLSNYNFDTFKNEILELPDYYFPYIGIRDKRIVDEFLFIWSKAYNNLIFKFETFVHKDFNINNLIFMPNKKKHLKCGIIDFQNAFWGHSSWDLFSLLEDSRVLFTNEFNEDLIKRYYLKTNQDISLNNFLISYNFLNLSRQTRLLGRWIKLSNDMNQKFYLNFVPVTLKRINNCINKINDDDLNKFYYKYILN